MTQAPDAMANLRAQYPQYKAIPDGELAQKVVAKYPQYRAAFAKYLTPAPPVPVMRPVLSLPGSHIMGEPAQSYDQKYLQPGSKSVPALIRDALLKNPNDPVALGKLKGISPYGQQRVSENVFNTQVHDFTMRFLNTFNPHANVPMEVAAALARNPHDPHALALLKKFHPVAQAAVAARIPELQKNAQINKEISFETDHPLAPHRLPKANVSQAIATMVHGPEGAKDLQTAPGAEAEAERFAYGLADPQNLSILGGLAAVPELAPVVGAGFVGQLFGMADKKLKEGDRSGAAFDMTLGVLGALGGMKHEAETPGGKLSTPRALWDHVENQRAFPALRAAAERDAAAAAAKPAGAAEPEAEKPAEAPKPKPKPKSKPKPVILDHRDADTPTSLLPTLTPHTPNPDELPASLRGAKPRYKQFDLDFERGTDKALYIVAKAGSRSDAAYMEHLRKVFPGKTDAEIREMGAQVREHIKSQAKSAEPGTLRVPHTHVGETLPSAPVSQFVHPVDMGYDQIDPKTGELVQPAEAPPGKFTIKGAESAVHEPETAGVLQRQPEEAGSGGGERGRVEQGQQGPETPNVLPEQGNPQGDAGAHAQAPEEKPVGPAYTPLPKEGGEPEPAAQKKSGTSRTSNKKPVLAEIRARRAAVIESVQPGDYLANRTIGNDSVLRVVGRTKGGLLVTLEGGSGTVMSITGYALDNLYSVKSEYVSDTAQAPEEGVAAPEPAPKPAKTRSTKTKAAPAEEPAAAPVSPNPSTDEPTPATPEARKASIADRMIKAGEDAKTRYVKKGSRLGLGIDPSMYGDALLVAQGAVVRFGRDFAGWAGEMRQHFAGYDLGDEFLHTLYDQASQSANWMTAIAVATPADTPRDGNPVFQHPGELRRVFDGSHRWLTDSLLGGKPIMRAADMASHRALTEYEHASTHSAIEAHYYLPKVMKVFDVAMKGGDTEAAANQVRFHTYMTADQMKGLSEKLDPNDPDTPEFRSRIAFGRAVKPLLDPVTDKPITEQMLSDYFSDPVVKQAVEAYKPLADVYARDWRLSGGGDERAKGFYTGMYSPVQALMEDDIQKPAGGGGAASGGKRSPILKIRATPRAQHFTGSADSYSPDFTEVHSASMEALRKAAAQRTLYKTMLRGGLMVPDTVMRQAVDEDGDPLFYKSGKPVMQEVQNPKVEYRDGKRYVLYKDRWVPAEKFNLQDRKLYVGKDGSIRPSKASRIAKDLPRDVIIPADIWDEMRPAMENHPLGDFSEFASNAVAMFMEKYLAHPADVIQHTAALGSRAAHAALRVNRVPGIAGDPIRYASALWTVGRSAYYTGSFLYRAITSVGAETTPDQFEALQRMAKAGVLQPDMYDKEPPKSLLGKVTTRSKGLLYGPQGILTHAGTAIYTAFKNAGALDTPQGENMLYDALRDMNTTGRTDEARLSEALHQIGFGTFMQTGFKNRVVAYRAGPAAYTMGLIGRVLLGVLAVKALDDKNRYPWQIPGYRWGNIPTGFHNKDGTPIYINMAIADRTGFYSDWALGSMMTSLSNKDTVYHGAVNLATAGGNNLLQPMLSGPAYNVGSAVTGTSLYMVPNKTLSGVTTIPNKSAKTKGVRRALVILQSGLPILGLVGDTTNGLSSTDVNNPTAYYLSRALRMLGSQPLRAGTNEANSLKWSRQEERGYDRLGMPKRLKLGGPPRPRIGF